jgi:integrase/recombinase XerD
MNHFDDFIKYMKQVHYSDLTINSCKYVMKKAIEYFRRMNLEDERHINESHINQMIKHLKDKRTPNWFIVKLIQSLKIYFRYLDKVNVIFINPMENIRTPKEIRKRINVLNQNKLLENLSKINTESDLGIRGKSILELMYSTGIRPFELSNIELNDLDLYHKELFINKGKNRKDRVVPIGETALYWLKKYLTEVRPKYLKNKTNNYLFITMNGTSKKLTRRGLYDVTKFIFLKNSIKRFKPYSLRVSCATHCLINGMNIMYIQKLLGHNSVNTTKGYLQIKLIDLKNELSKSHPRINFNLKGETI